MTEHADPLSSPDVPSLMSPAKFELACFIDNMGGSTSLSRIQANTRFSQSHLSRLVRTLCDEGILITARHGAGRGSVTRVELTGHGYAELERLFRYLSTTIRGMPGPPVDARTDPDRIPPGNDEE